MRHPCAKPALLETRSKLHQAARIAAGDDVGIGGGERVQLAREHRPGHGGLGEVVGAGGAAAARRIVVVDQLDPRDRGQQPTRRRPHPLAVHQMAGVVVADAGLDAAEGRVSPSGPSQSGYSRSAAPHPAEFTTTASAPAKAARLRRARSRAKPACPAWAWRAPQQP